MAFWEMLKMEIRTKTISISKHLANSRNCRKMEIPCRLQVLAEFICNNFHSPDIDKVLNELDDLKTELQIIYTRKENAAIFRSKYIWLENGEHPTKQFLCARIRRRIRPTYSRQQKF